MLAFRVLFTVGVPALAAITVASDDICLEPICTRSSGYECDRQAEECPQCLYYNRTVGLYMCYTLTSLGECKSTKYTLCDTMLTDPNTDVSAGTNSNDGTLITSGAGSAPSDEPTPTTTPPAPTATVAPTPVTAAPPTQTIQGMNGAQDDSAGFPSWIIIVLGIAFGAALAVFGYKRRRQRLQTDAATRTPFDDGKYHEDRTPTNPLGRTRHDTLDSSSNSEEMDTLASLPPMRKHSDSCRPANRRLANDRVSSFREEPSAPTPTPTRTPPPPSRDSYSTHIPDREYAKPKSKALPKPLPSVNCKPTNRSGGTNGSSGWGAVAPPPDPPCKQRTKQRDSWGTNAFTDEFATTDGSEWMDTNYMDLDTLRPSDDGDEDLYTMNNSTSAGTDLYTSMANDDDMMTMTRRHHDNDAYYPDTSLPVSPSRGGVFDLETMRQRDTGTFHDDEIIDLSRRDPAPAIGRKKEAKDKVAKWKTKYMAL